MGDMKPLRVSDASTVILGLQEEIQRSQESRYDHRLHGVLLVAQGMSCRQVAGLLGDGPRTVQYWVHAFEREGLAGLQEGERPGRPRRLGRQSPVGIRAPALGRPFRSPAVPTAVPNLGFSPAQAPLGDRPRRSRATSRA
jgi:hypothetical protein